MNNMKTAEPDTIRIGDFLIIQRQKYTKLHKLTATSTPTLGREIINLENVAGERYFTTFKMVLAGSAKKRIYDLEPMPDFRMTLTDEIGEYERDHFPRFHSALIIIIFFRLLQRWPRVATITGILWTMDSPRS